MIEIYTDGSFYKSDESVPSKICAGTGVVIRYIDQQYPNELISEEYFAFRYTCGELINKISDELGVFQCFDDISSTLIECIALSEGISLLKEELTNDKIIFHVDDVSLMKMVNHYIKLINNKLEIEDSKHYGSILCMIHNIFKDNLDLLKQIEMRHVRSHKDNKFNNMADYLASYRTKPVDRVTNLLIRNAEFVTASDKKQYFLYLQNLKNM